MELSEWSEGEGPRRFINKNASRIGRFWMVYVILNDHQLVVFLFSCPSNDKRDNWNYQRANLRYFADPLLPKYGLTYIH